MNILNRDEPYFTTAYELSLDNFILAIKHPDYPYKFILPLAYYSDKTSWMSIDKSEVGNEIWIIDSSTSDSVSLEARFNKLELFKIVKNLRHNSRFDGINPSLTPFATYQGSLIETETDEFIEIVKGSFDFSTLTIKDVNSEISSLLLSVNIKSNRPIYVNISDEKAIGPFLIIGEDKGVFKLSKWKNEPVKELDFQSHNEYIIEFDLSGQDRKIVDNFNIDLDSLPEIDVISDIEIIEWAAKEVSSKIPDDFLTFLESIGKISTSETYYPSRYSRLLNLIKDVDINILKRQEFINLLPELQQVKDELYAQNEKINIQTKNLNEIKRSLAESSNLLNELDDSLALKTQHIENKESEYQAIIENINKAKEDAISEEIKELEAKRDQLKAELDDKIVLQEKIKSYTKLEYIQGAVMLKEEEEKVLKNQIAELTNTLLSLRKEFIDAQKDANVKLKEFLISKTHFDFINNREFENNEKTFSFRETPLIQGNKLNNSLTELVKKTEEFLKQNGREFDSHFVANLLISLHQNTLTIFSGLPGTGKTSLAQLLTSYLVSSSRVCQVSVSRGWTSQKDLIGFANPLTRKFYAAQTGVYDLMKQLDYEYNTSSPLSLPISFVLLDEANLSPIEHYWSLFYGLTDEIALTNKPSTVNLGNGDVYNFSNNIRFIGTINIDQTTEELSPRLLDRINLIRMEPLKKSIYQIIKKVEEPLDISLAEIKEMFSLRDNFSNPLTELDELPDFDEIKRIFEKSFRIPISPRVEIGIREYCSLASKVMVEGKRPLDYCIAQRLLPKINLQGEKYNQPLKELREKIIGFRLNDSLSIRILDEIIRFGEEDGYFSHHYNYFSIS